MQKNSMTICVWDQANQPCLFQLTNCLAYNAKISPVFYSEIAKMFIALVLEEKEKEHRIKFKQF
jgi:hypothetical protein